MENITLNQPKKPKKNRSSLLVSNFQEFNTSNDKKIDSVHELNIEPTGKRSSLKKTNRNLLLPNTGNDMFGGDMGNTLGIPGTDSFQGDTFKIIKMSKLSTMRGGGSPSTLISRQAQEQSIKRMTIKSPINGFSNRNQSSMSRKNYRGGGSKMKESRLNSQASRIEDRISRLNAPEPINAQKNNKSDIFFFENQNENKIIDVQITTGDKSSNQVIQNIRVDQNKVNAYLKRRNYGSKWFIGPKKWDQVMKKNNQKQLRSMFKNVDESISEEYNSNTKPGNSY